MFIKMFCLPFLGAVYASGWWAWAIFRGNGEIMAALILVGIAYFALLCACIWEDLG